MPGLLRSRSDASLERRTVAESMGLHLCEDCLKSNEECLKKLADNLKEPHLQLSGIMDDVLKQRDDFAKVVEQQGKLIQELKQEIDELHRNFSTQMEINEEMTKELTSMFESKLETLATQVKTVQRSVVDLKTTVEVNEERMKRQNNIVVFNLAENDANSKSDDKDLILKLLMEVTNRDITKDIVEIFRMGRRTENTKKVRPILVKLESAILKNLILENAFKLKKSEAFNKVVLNHDMSKEDREECKKLMTEKQKKLDHKGTVRIRGWPGSFRAVANK